MKTLVNKLIIIFFMILFSLHVSYSQNYQCFNPAYTYIFKANNNTYRAFRADSIIYDSLKTTIIPFKEVNIQDDGFHHCTKIDSSIWMGRYMIIYNNGYYNFINKNYDTISINTLADLNQEWICYSFKNGSYIKCKVTGIDTMSFLEISDTVKAFKFQYYDQSGVAQSHKINSFSMKISKNYGFVETVNFYYFPDIKEWYNIEKDSLKQFVLSGIPSIQKGTDNLTWKEVCNYDIGDERHTQYTYNFPEGINNYPAYDCVKTKSVVTGKKIEGTKVIYTYKLNSQSTIKRIAGIFVTKNIKDSVVIETINLINMDFDKLPREMIHQGNGYSGFHLFYAYEMSSGLTIPKLCKYTIFEPERYSYEKTNDSCYHTGFGEIWQTNYYYKGLGGAYYTISTLRSYTSYSLVYYKKGSETWGKEVDFISGIQDHEQTKQYFVLYQNGENAILSFNDAGSSPYYITLTDINGKILKKYNNQETSLSIPIRELDNGIYLLIVTNNKGIRVAKKLFVSN